jgi:hypothetical protein
LAQGRPAAAHKEHPIWRWLTSLLGEIYTSKAFGGGAARPAILYSGAVVLAIAVVGAVVHTIIQWVV